MADAGDLKSLARKGVRVRLPPSAPTRRSDLHCGASCCTKNVEQPPNAMNRLHEHRRLSRLA